MKHWLPHDFYFIPFRKASAAYNMACDELLYSLAQMEGRSSFRVYAWARPSISIGFFQRVSTLNQDTCQHFSIPIVRRITGGRAVFHCRELTFSFAFPLEDNTVSRKALFLEVSEVIVAGLKAMGHQAMISMSSYGNLKNASCFESRVMHEITDTQGKKLSGTALLIKNNAVLLQGSIPLSDSFRDIEHFLADTPTHHQYQPTHHPTSITDAQSIAQFLLGIKTRVSLHLGREFTPEQLQTIDTLIQKHYANHDWTTQR